MRPCIAFFALCLATGAQAPLRLVQTIPLPSVTGRIDHLAADPVGHRLFVCALGNNTLEVLDLKAGRRERSIGGFHEPQGVAYAPQFHRIFVANAGDGALRVLNSDTFQAVQTVGFGDDADNVRYDAARKQIWVGYGSGALGVVDAATGKRLAEIQLDGHPESFRLEESGPRVFVNVPTASHIAVIDRQKRAVEAKWPLTQARANFPMFLDEANHRLFAGCRRPAEVLALDTATGKVAATLPCVGDTDDLFYDAVRKRVYVSGGEGFLSVFARKDPDHYELAAKIATAPGARTSLYVPELGRVYLAVPRRGSRAAEVRVYQAE